MYSRQRLTHSRDPCTQVNGELWDLDRPFEKSSTLELFDFESPEGQSVTLWPDSHRTGTDQPSIHLSGKRVWWHSSAHVLGECAERHYGCHLAIGPPTDDGFFYEMGMQDERYATGPGKSLNLDFAHFDSCGTVSHSQVTPADYPALETLVKSVVKEKQKFERLVVSKENLLKMFAVRGTYRSCDQAPA